MIKLLLLKAAARVYRKMAGIRDRGMKWPEDDRAARVRANDIIYQLLSGSQPCYIGRIGTGEGQIVINYLSVHSRHHILRKCYDFMRDKARYPWWDMGRQVDLLVHNAGFFAPSVGIPELERFSEIYLKYIPTMDLCGRFASYEDQIPFGAHCRYVQLEMLYPFLTDNSWMRALRHKKVLVIHPFKKTIEQQYARREKLFDNPDCLPEFASLTVIKAVQSAAGSETGFRDWFEALEYMKDRIDASDFDIALIGCGAYGLPLAGYCKKIGKKAVHMGGGLQLLFGIKGKRWEQQYDRSCYRDLFNEYWVYPDETEKPQGAASIENGCYW